MTQDTLVAIVGVVTILGLLLFGVTYLVVGLARENRQALMDVIASQETERRELLERIQRPERIPSAAAAPPRETPPMDPEKAKAYAAIGSVQPYRGES